MGLDWNPGPKPKPGFEGEFRDLFQRIESEPATPSPEPSRSMLGGILGALGLGGGKPAVPERPSKDTMLARLREISITPFETLGAPQVGSDPAADEWARERYAQQSANMSKDRWMSRMKGYYVLDAVPPCDGLPRYTNGQPGGYVEAFSFRADFLKDCEDIVSTELLGEAFESKLDDALVEFGEALLTAAKQYAGQRDIDLDGIDADRLIVEAQSKMRNASDGETSESDGHNPPEMDELRLDIVRSAGRWCLFWGSRGHLMEAYW